MSDSALPPSSGSGQDEGAGRIALKTAGAFAAGFLLLYLLCTEAALRLINDLLVGLWRLLLPVLEILAEAD